MPNKGLNIFMWKKQELNSSKSFNVYYKFMILKIILVDCESE